MTKALCSLITGIALLGVGTAFSQNRNGSSVKSRVAPTTASAEKKKGGIGRGKGPHATASNSGGMMAGIGHGHGPHHKHRKHHKKS